MSVLERLRLVDAEIVALRGELDARLRDDPAADDSDLANLTVNLLISEGLRAALLRLESEQ